MTKTRSTAHKNEQIRISWIGLVVSLIMLAALIVLIVLNLGEAEHFLQLMRQAEP